MNFPARFFIRENNGSVSGPHDMEALRRLINEGRCTLFSESRGENERRWRAIGTRTEFLRWQDANAPDGTSKGTTLPALPPPCHGANFPLRQTQPKNELFPRIPGGRAQERRHAPPKVPVEEIVRSPKTPPPLPQADRRPESDGEAKSQGFEFPAPLPWGWMPGLYLLIKIGAILRSFDFEFDPDFASATEFFLSIITLLLVGVLIPGALSTLIAPLLGVRDKSFRDSIFVILSLLFVSMVPA
jgi:hypothetical protein